MLPLGVGHPQEALVTLCTATITERHGARASQGPQSWDLCTEILCSPITKSHSYPCFSDEEADEKHQGSPSRQLQAVAQNPLIVPDHAPTPRLKCITRKSGQVGDFSSEQTVTPSCSVYQSLRGNLLWLKKNRNHSPKIHNLPEH